MRKAKDDMDHVSGIAKEKMNELLVMKPAVFDGVSEQTIGSLIQYFDVCKRAFDKLKAHSASPLTGTSRTVVVESTQAPKRSALPSQPTGSRVPPKFDCEWHYLDNGVNQQGPLTFQQLKASYQKGDIDGGTHVFGGEMADWQMVSQVPDLRAALSA
jgi:hypothetical protein